MPIHVYTSVPLLQDTLAQTLALRRNPFSRVACSVVVDLPRGWVWSNAYRLGSGGTVVISDNPCPEYKLDLLSLKPAALIDFTPSALLEAVRAVEAGQTMLPEVSSVLTPTERLTLRLVANGHSLKAVALMRGTKINTTRNTVQTLYAKLGLKSAVQLALYYYGNWTTLPNFDDFTNGTLEERKPHTYETP